MKSRLMRGFLAGVALLSISGSLFAHHGNAANDSRTVTVKGTVTAWVWTNPHTFLQFDAKDEKHDLTHSLGELTSPSTLVNFGLTATSFNPSVEATATL